LDEINLRKTEEQLKSNPWIKDAELFFDNHQILHVKISEREPVARVFTKSGESFYIDSSGLRLPVTENATARVIVFTSFPSDKKVLSKPDSLVLNDVKTITQYINADSFLNAQTAQINITSQRTYEITPVVGDQVIRIGDAENLDEKFTKLLAFYRQVFSKVGFERYSVIDVQYEGQVVAVRRGEKRTVSDTAKAMRQLAKADTKLDKALKDTTYAAPMSKPAIVDSVNDLNDKKVTNNTKTGVRKPKAVMGKKV
jgi:cell division protein FtsQ